jgi:hypothetical protein
LGSYLKRPALHENALLSARLDNSIQNFAREGLENNSIIRHGKNSSSSGFHASWVDASFEMFDIYVPDP